MPRNASGTYSLPSGNPVSSGTLIDANWANNTLNDLANEVTDSLSRSAEGGMLAPLRLTDGVQATPSLAFTNEPSSGLYRAGTNDAWFVSGGNQVMQFTSSGVVGRLAAGAVGTPSLTFFGDLNTGLWSPAADTLAASTGGSERLRLDSSGNVGIGTASPGGRLDVFNSGVARLTVGAGGLSETYSDANSHFWRTPGGGTELARLNSSGNLGLSAGNAPTQRLSLYAAGSTAQYMSAGNSNTGVNGSLFGVDTAGNAVVNNTQAFALIFSTNNTERARFDSSGNLGIGTASPGAKLDVIAADNSLQMRVGAATRGLEIKTFQAVGTNNAGIIYDAPVVGAGTHVFQTGSVERMRIDDDGNVSVGNGTLATTATDGFLYVPTCAGTPTGTPTAKTGYAPIVVNTTNNKLYFYSGGAWRDAGP